jgi:hypothetical protein
MLHSAKGYVWGKKLSVRLFYPFAYHTHYLTYSVTFKCDDLTGRYLGRRGPTLALRREQCTAPCALGQGCKRPEALRLVVS